MKSKSSFKNRISAVISKIPRGKTLTYKEVAQRAGRPKAYRAIGNILNANRNPKIPCLPAGRRQAGLPPRHSL